MTVSREALRAQWFGAHRAHRERIEACKQRPRLPIPDACPACAAPVARDGTLAYCAKRCGWFATPGGGRPVIAAEPAASTRTHDPDPTDPKEDMTTDDCTESTHDDDDLVDDMVEEAVAPLARKPRKAPPPKPERRAYGEGRTLVLDAIHAGKDGYRSLRDATGLGDSSLYGALKSLEKDGLIRVVGEEKQRRYLPTEAKGKSVPKKPGPKPKAKVQKPAAEPVATSKSAPAPASPSPVTPERRGPGLEATLAILRGLSQTDLDALLDRLAPACAARANYLAYVRGLAA